MKKTLLTLSLLAALVLSGCNGELEPSNIDSGNTPEEPLIRGTGIVDRFLFTSDDNPEKDTHCAIAFEDSKLVLSFDKAFSFTAMLLEEETDSVAFIKKYVNVTLCTIPLSDIADGTYSLYLNFTNVCTFSVKDGKRFAPDDKPESEEEQKSPWYDPDNMFCDLKFHFEKPELDFSKALYPLSEEESDEWPFGEAEKLELTVSRIGEVPIYMAYDTQNPSVLMFHFSLGEYYCINGNTQVGEKPHTGNYTLEQINAINNGDIEYWEIRERGYMVPTLFDTAKKNTADDGTVFYSVDLPVTVRPATIPYQIEIIDVTGALSAVTSLSVKGFSQLFVSSRAEGEDYGPYGDGRHTTICKDILPVRTIQLPQGTVGSIAAAKIRTWNLTGEVPHIPITLIFTALFEDGHEETFSFDITDQVAAQLKGGVISIGVPN